MRLFPSMTPWYVPRFAFCVSPVWRYSTEHCWQVASEPSGMSDWRGCDCDSHGGLQAMPNFLVNRRDEGEPGSPPGQDESSKMIRSISWHWRRSSAEKTAVSEPDGFARAAIHEHLMLRRLARSEQMREFFIQMWIQNPALARQGGSNVRDLRSPSTAADTVISPGFPSSHAADIAGVGE